MMNYDLRHAPKQARLGPNDCRRTTLPRRLKKALEAVVNQEGDDIYFVLRYLNPPTARSYMSQLKRRGLAYTHRSSGTIEVWAHDKGRKLARLIRRRPVAEAAKVGDRWGAYRLHTDGWWRLEP